MFNLFKTERVKEWCGKEWRVCDYVTSSLSICMW